MLSTVYDRIIVELFQRHWKPDITETCTYVPKNFLD